MTRASAINNVVPVTGGLSSVLGAVLRPLGALVVALALFAVFMACSGQPPLRVLAEMFRGAFGTWFSFQNTLQRAAPLMLTALCTAIPARLGLVIIGGEGALVLGGLGAVAAGRGLAGASPVVVLLGMIVAAALVGGLWIGTAGALRAYRGVNETISSLLMTYIGIAIFNHLVEGPMRDPASLNKASTFPIGDANALGNMPGLDVHWGLGYGIVACFVVYLLMDRSVFGFAARMVGGNVKAARLSGLAVPRLMVMATVLAGACAGIAGMAEVAAVHGTANASLIAGYGYSGILVAFIARHHPLGVLPVALLLGGISASGGLLQRTFHLPDATVNVLQGLLFVVILASESYQGPLSLFRMRRAAPVLSLPTDVAAKGTA